MGKHSLVYNIVTPTEEIKESYYVVSNNVSSKVESRNSKHPEISGGIARIRDWVCLIEMKFDFSIACQASRFQGVRIRVCNMANYEQ